MNPSAQRLPVMDRMAAVILPALAAAASIAVSWHHWIFPFIDSGVVMDVPARVERGERLYRDISYGYGPISPEVTALLYKVFGDRWSVVEVLGVILGAAILALTYHLTEQAGSRLAAVVSTTLAAAICFGAAPPGCAFIFHYSYPTLFALVGALVVIAAAAPTEPAAGARVVATGGLLLVLLSRPEVGVLVAGLLVVSALASSSRVAALVAIAPVILTSGAVALVVYAYMFVGLPMRDLLKNSPLVAIALSHAARNAYWIKAGLTGGELGPKGLAYSLAILFLLLAAAAPSFLNFRIRLHGVRREWAWVILLAAGAGAFLRESPQALHLFFFPLPLLAAVAAIFLLRRPLVGRRRLRFLIFALAAAFGSRAIFNFTVGTVTSPYVVPALPGLLSMACILAFDEVGWRLPEPGNFRRRLAVMALVPGVLLLEVAWHDTSRTVQINTAAGTLRRPGAESKAISQAIGFLAKNGKSADMLLSLPEAGFFNFVTGMQNPIRYEEIMPEDLDAADEAETADVIRRRAPRFVLVANRPTGEYGKVAFGSDYSVALWKGIQARYRLAAAFGDAALKAQIGDPRFFIRIYELQR